MPMDQSAAEAGRRHAFDSLRGAMIVAVVLFHAGLPYARQQVVFFQDTHTSFFFDLLDVLLNSFQMPLFFVAAGFFGALLYRERGLNEFVRNRARRVLLPLIVAWLVLVPLTSGAVTFARAAAATNALMPAFEYVSHGRWIRWRPTYHLWFLFALLNFYPIGLLSSWIVSRLGDFRQRAIHETVRRCLASPWRPLMLAVILGALGTAALAVACLFTPTPFISNHALQRVFLPATIPVFFLLGWALYRQTDVFAPLRRHAWTYVAIGLAVLPIVTWSWHAALRDPAHEAAALLGIAAAGACIMSAFMTFGLLGLFLTYGEKPSAATRYVSDASYWTYLVHLPVVVFIGGLLVPADLPAIAKWSMTLAVTMPLVLLSYQWCVRFTAIGMLLNGRRQVRSRGTATAGSAAR